MSEYNAWAQTRVCSPVIDPNFAGRSTIGLVLLIKGYFFFRHPLRKQRYFASLS